MQLSIDWDQSSVVSWNFLLYHHIGDHILFQIFEGFQILDVPVRDAQTFFYFYLFYFKSKFDTFISRNDAILPECITPASHEQ